MSLRNKTNDGKLMMEPGLWTQEFQEFWTQRPHPKHFPITLPSFTYTISVNPHTARKEWILAPFARQRGWSSQRLLTCPLYRGRNWLKFTKGTSVPRTLMQDQVFARQCAKDLGYRDLSSIKCNCSLHTRLQGIYMGKTFIWVKATEQTVKRLKNKQTLTSKIPIAET